MQINQRKAGVLLNYLGEAIKILTALIYTPIMLRLLGQSEYGLYQLVSSTVAYLSLLSLGFGSAYVRYFSRYRAKEDNAGVARLNGMFLSIFSVMAVACLLCGGVMAANAGMIFGDGLTARELAKAKVLLAILIVNMALTFPNSVFNCYLTAHEKFVFQKLVMVAQNLLNPFLTLPLLLMGYDSVAMVLISTLLTLVSLAMNVCFCFKKLRMKVSFKAMEFSLLKEMSVFTFFIFLNQIIDQLNWSVDKFLLGRMCGTTAVAVYGIGGQLNSMYLQMSTAVSNVFIPKVNRIVANSDDNRELTKLMVKVGRVQLAILALILTGFALFGKPFIRLWAGNGYDGAFWVALLLMIPVTLPLIQNLGIEIQRAKNKHQARSIVYVCLAAVNVALSVFFVRRWGVVGAAAGTTISLLLGNGLFMNWYYHKKLGLDIVFFWKQMVSFIPPVVVAALFGTAYVFTVKVDSLVVLLASIGIYAAIYGVIVWLLGLNAEEKQMVKGILDKMRQGKHRD